MNDQLDLRIGPTTQSCSQGGDVPVQVTPEETVLAKNPFGDEIKKDTAVVIAYNPEVDYWVIIAAEC